MIIPRYLTREVTLTLIAITGILLVTFLSNQFAFYLNQAASGKFASEMLLRLIAVTTPHLLSLVLPLGLFLGILLGYSRLYADNEMTVMSACGLSQARLVAFTLPITIVIVIIITALCFWLNPHLLAYRNNLLAQSGTATELQTTTPGRFQQAEGGRRIFYVEKISADKQRMYNIFVGQLPKNVELTPAALPWTISTAESGYQTINASNGDRFFVTVNGHRYTGTPGQNDFQTVQYGKYGIRIESHAAAVNKEVETMPTLALWHATENRAMALGELQWRFALPWSALLLALLAIPLSRVQPRQGRYARLLPAILIYIVYTDLLVVARNWVQHDIISAKLGLWWVHGLMLLVILAVWAREIGWQRLKQLWQKFL